MEKILSESDRCGMREEAKRAGGAEDGGVSGTQSGGRDPGKAERALKQMMGGTLVGKEVCCATVL